MKKEMNHIATLVRRGISLRLGMAALTAVLCLASCSDEWTDAPQLPGQVPEGMKTVTVDFQLPEGKPGFEEGKTRANTTNGTWAEGDELLMKIMLEATENEATTYYNSYVTLTYASTDNEGNAKWNVAENNNVVHLVHGGESTYPDYLLLAQTTDIDLSQPLSILVPEDMTLDDGFPKVELHYAPEMEWNINRNENGILALKPKADAFTSAPEMWTLAYSGWTTNLARLRVYTNKAGDVVTLTSVAFSPVLRNFNEGTYTATTDDQGYAYFYGTANGLDDGGRPTELTSGLTLQLTAVKMGEDDEAFTCPIAPVTLLEASELVPVLLDQGKSYLLDATDKRAEATKGMVVFTSDNITAEAVAAALNSGKNTLYVMGDLMDNMDDKVGSAISESEAANGSIDLVMPDATSIGDNAFYSCDALSSVSLPLATTIGNYAFEYCNALTSVSLPSVTTIGNYAFRGKPDLLTLTFGSVITSVGTNAFLSTEPFSRWTTQCALTLNSGQKDVADESLKATEGSNSWAGYDWKSISYVDDEGDAVSAP